MRKLLPVLFLLATTAFAGPVQWTGSGSNGHWYEKILGNFSWTQAQAYATARGGYLATITSAAENAFITSLLASGEMPFIGATDVVEEGTFRWADGPEGNQLLTYTNWRPLEPNNVNGNEHYAQIFHDGLWNDVPVTSQGGLMVEWDVEPVPEPSTMALFGAGILTMVFVSRRRAARS